MGPTKGIRAQYQWHPASVLSIVFPKCLQAQHKKQPTTDHSVASTGWPHAGHKQQLTLACTGAPLKNLQNQQTGWPASDHTRAPPNQLHKWQTQRAGPRASLKQLLLRGVSSCTTASPSTVVTARSHSQSENPSPQRRAVAIKTHCKRRAHTQGTPLECPAQVPRG